MKWVHFGNHAVNLDALVRVEYFPTGEWMKRKHVRILRLYTADSAPHPDSQHGPARVREIHTYTDEDAENLFAMIKASTAELSATPPSPDNFLSSSRPVIRRRDEGEEEPGGDAQ